MSNSNELKRKLIDMLAWFHDFCEANHLRYYLVCGTMLGAVRHQGFIPWDDDIDVGMPRTDYERLAELLSTSKGQRYILETPHSQAKDFLYTFSKLYDTKTTLVENTRYRIKRGVYLDIFPLDGIADSEQQARKRYRKIDIAFKLLLARTTGFRKGRSWLKNLSVAIARCIPNYLLDNKKLQRYVDECAKQNDFDECKYGGSLFGGWRYKEIMERSVMGTPTLYKFEDIYVFGVEDCETYLTNLYGEWRKLPPLEKQVSHHDFLYLSLDESYLESRV